MTFLVGYVLTIGGLWFQLWLHGRDIRELEARMQALEPKGRLSVAQDAWDAEEAL